MATKKKAAKTATKTKATAANTRLEQQWEIAVSTGIPWDTVKNSSDEEREFLLEKARESKKDYLKKQKEETERREQFEQEVKERQEQQMAMMAQQQRNQNFQNPPSFAPPPQNYPYGLPNQMPQGAMPQGAMHQGAAPPPQ